jgi:coproporphyrinogen III oxidase-like Fe-S oxidoreductase
MSGIYIHIPFASKRHYCDFHFRLHEKGGNGAGFIKEIRLRKSESDGENVETIYFGEERLAY